MKKTMIIALLAVLVMGVFIACDGDVNADLVGGRTITLEIVPSNESDWTFDKGNKSLDVTIPEGCETWGDLVGKCSITIVAGSSNPVTIDLIADSQYVFFYKNGGGTSYYGFIDPNAKWSPETVQKNTPIALGKAYDLEIVTPL